MLAERRDIMDGIGMVKLVLRSDVLRNLGLHSISGSWRGARVGTRV